jgi:ribokinase
MFEMMRDLVVVGSLNVDVSVRADRLPAAGETVRAHSLRVGPGGKGLNQAVAAARMGGRVHMVGHTGADRFAEIPLAALREEGIDATYVKSLEGQHTGTALIVVDGSGQNQIAVAGGANVVLSPEHVRGAIAAFRASAVLLVQLEAPLDAVQSALELAREHGLRTVLDPAPARELSPALLRLVDVLTPNETEARFLTGLEVRDPESAARAGRQLVERTQGDVLVTLGAQGVVWCYATGFDHVPAPRVEALDATGAGDALCGALGVELARELPLGRSLERAVRAATASTLRAGAAASMPRAAELASLLPG